MISANPDAVSLVFPGSPSTVTISGGTPPYSYVGSSNALAAIGSLVSSVLTVVPIGVGLTLITVSDSVSATVVIPVAVFPLGVPINQQYFPFTPQNPIGTGGVFNTDILIEENYPGIIFDGTEANAVTQTIREVNGNFWIVTNADWNIVTASWQQNGSNNPSLPAYAWEYTNDGSSIRYFAMPTLAQNVDVTWVNVFQIRSDGTVVSFPSSQVTSNDRALALNPIWDNPTDDQRAFEINVTDILSPALSQFEAFVHNGSILWEVDKTGTLTAGIIPFARVTGPFTGLFNNATFTGTTNFNGPVDANDGLNVTGGLTTDGFHDTGNSQIDGAETINGLLTASGGINTTNVNASGTVTATGIVTAGGLELSGATPVFSYIGQTITATVLWDTTTGGSGQVFFVPVQFPSGGSTWTVTVTFIVNNAAGTSGTLTPSNAQSPASAINPPSITIGSPPGNGAGSFSYVTTSVAGGSKFLGMDILYSGTSLGMGFAVITAIRTI